MLRATGAAIMLATLAACAAIPSPPPPQPIVKASPPAPAPSAGDAVTDQFIARLRGDVPMRPASGTVVGRLAAYRAAVAAQLRDPGSAQFSNLRLLQSAGGDVRLCGAVNARNGFGGYAGATLFSADFQGGDPRQIINVMMGAADLDQITARCAR